VSRILGLERIVWYSSLPVSTDVEVQYLQTSVIFFYSTIRASDRGPKHGYVTILEVRE
jgi:hypothetical protein